MSETDVESKFEAAAQESDKGNYLTAFQIYDQLTREPVDPMMNGVALMLCGRLLAYGGQHERAWEYLDRAASLLSSNPLVRLRADFNRAELLFLTANYTESAVLLASVLERAPLYPDGDLDDLVQACGRLLGMVHNRLGRHQEAIAILGPRVESDGTDFEASFYLADSLASSGEHGKAREIVAVARPLAGSSEWEKAFDELSNRTPPAKPRKLMTKLFKHW